jgi:hypothetical protein
MCLILEARWQMEVKAVNMFSVRSILSKEKLRLCVSWEYMCVSGHTAPFILNFDTRWDDWSVSWPVRCNLVLRPHGGHWRGGWLGSGSGLDPWKEVNCPANAANRNTILGLSRLQTRHYSDHAAPTLLRPLDFSRDILGTEVHTSRYKRNFTFTTARIHIVVFRAMRRRGFRPCLLAFETSTLRTSAWHKRRWRQRLVDIYQKTGDYVNVIQCF